MNNGGRCFLSEAPAAVFFADGTAGRGLALFSADNAALRIEREQKMCLTPSRRTADWTAGVPFGSMCQERYRRPRAESFDDPGR